MKVPLLLLITLSALIFWACTITNPITLLGPDTPKTILDIPVGWYENVIRFPDGKIIVTAGSRGSVSHFYDLNENQFHEIPSPPDERCPHETEYILPTALPDGRLGFRMSCSGRWPDRVIGQDGASYIVAYDWNTGAFEQIVETELPYSATGYTWNPDMTRGVQAIGSLLGTISWITPQGMEPITLTLSEGGKSWTLDENLAAMNNTDRIDVGIARSPAWSSDGRWIVFLASVDAIGLKDGFARARASHNLYRLDPETLQTEVLVEGITNTSAAKSLTWSPDSQWVLIRGRIKSRDGLWVISVDGKSLHLIDTSGEGRFDGEEWLDNRTIIAIKCLNSDWPCPRSELIQYDVSQIF